MRNNQDRQSNDPIGSYLKAANRDFFGSLATIDPTTRAKALIGFIVFAVGLAIIVTQIV